MFSICALEEYVLIRSALLAFIGAVASSAAMAAWPLGNIPLGGSSDKSENVNNVTNAVFDFTFDVVGGVSPLLSFAFSKPNDNAAYDFAAISAVSFQAGAASPVSLFSGPGLVGNPQTFNLPGSFGSGGADFYKLSVVASESGTGTSHFNVAVTAAVPEAHEWAMMLTGLGLVGYVAARRRRRSDDAPAMLS
jgi:hypothetical protein